MPRQIDYPAAIIKFQAWTMEVHNRINAIQREYAALKLAVDTGEGDPNTLILTPAQIAVMKADMEVLEAEVLALCSAYDVEPVEPEVTVEPEG